MSARALQADRAPTRRQQAAEQTRTRIATAAHALFHQRGFEAVTTDEIAAAAGVAKGTLFLHAPTKERLLVLAYQGELGRASALAASRVSSALPAPAALAQVFSRFFRLYEKEPDLARRFVREVQFLSPEAAPGLEEARVSLLRRMVDLLAQRRLRGEIAADVDLELVAATSFLLYYGVLAGWLSGVLPDAPSRDRVLRESLGLLWRGLDQPVPAEEPARRETSRRKRSGRGGRHCSSGRAAGDAG